MDLVTGLSYWPYTLEAIPAYPTLAEDLTCDVLVIGGGMAGSMISYMLHNSGLDTVLVDGHTIAGGSSGANTGIIQYFNDKTLTGCIHTYGEQNGVAFYKLCEQAVDTLAEIMTRENIEGAITRRESLYMASDDSDVPMLKEEYETLRKNGFEVEYWDEADIAGNFSFNRPGAILAKGDALLNPLKCVHGLVSAAAAAGMRVYEHTRIESRQDTPDGIILYTKDRYRIRAKHAVYATGYRAQEMKPNANARLFTSYVLVTEPLPQITDWYRECMIWETARPYLYLRTTEDNRLIIGGEDEPMMGEHDRVNRLPVKQKQLLAQARSMFPHLDLRTAYAWSAVFGETHDGYPLIGSQPEYPNSTFALIYGGNGSVYATIAAEIIKRQLCGGEPHPAAHFFRFNRPSRTLPSQAGKERKEAPIVSGEA
ncbi:NAD(P)/FAD-dependent oxidoreductase [Paenibacillus lutrae]|uniref:FAD-dependent oxidoreductase n=1 Tax=Paenibacillus lutrae TaxID=2078573 RepID=A0A7X3JZM8_9BACL|nr:FAD-dependent oxidoreductase [Paenibacillus lutrae]MVP00205.1 FAD-dependent oxidoreductase [Paenibacillus lutrae]